MKHIMAPNSMDRKLNRPLCVRELLGCPHYATYALRRALFGNVSEDPRNTTCMIADGDIYDNRPLREGGEGIRSLNRDPQQECG